MIAALALFAAAQKPAYPITWVREATYTYASAERPNETEVWKWRETVKVGLDDRVAVSRVLLENRVDGQKLPIPEFEVPDGWTLKGTQREPGLDEPAAFRLWRASIVPIAGTRIDWPAGTKIPTATAMCHATGSGTEKDRPRIAFTFAEPDGMKGKGEGTCGHDGYLRSGEMKLDGAFMPGGDFSPHRLTIKWVEIR